MCLLVSWKLHTEVVVHGSCTLHGSETWPVKIENEMTVHWAETRMIR